MDHKEIITLIITYTFTGAIVFTVIVTCLSMVGIIKFADKEQQKKLFSILIVELIVIAVGVFSGFLEFNPKQAVESVEKPAIAQGQDKANLLKTIDSLLPYEIQQLADKLKIEVVGKEIDEKAEKLRSRISNAETVSEINVIKEAYEDANIDIKFPSNKITIASWNIEQLGRDTSNKESRTPELISDYIKLSGSAIIALQEIYVTHEQEGTRRNSVLDQVFSILNVDDSNDWEYEILPNKNASDTSQLIAIAWNKNKVQLIEKNQLDVPSKSASGNSIWDRKPHSIRFVAGQDKTDFILVPLHMKSNFGGIAPNAIRRKEEAEALFDELLAEAGNQNESDLIVLGNTNILKNTEPAIAIFEEIGDLRDLNKSDMGTYWSATYGEAPFDRIFVSKQPEFALSAQYALVASDLAGHDLKLSDHFMVLTTISIKNDDD